MKIIDADKFLKYLIFSKHIDSLTCKEVKEAVEMCKVDIFDKIRAEIDSHCSENRDRNDGLYIAMKIIDKYKGDNTF
ncbi:MAG: hypothetical protein IKE18_03740 [Oscillospiraceae bacterium]|nr:hypothetical protein [Oscillospiraceae bacterium]